MNRLCPESIKICDLFEVYIDFPQSLEIKRLKYSKP